MSETDRNVLTLRCLAAETARDRLQKEVETLREQLRASDNEHVAQGRQLVEHERVRRMHEEEIAKRLAAKGVKPGEWQARYRRLSGHPLPYFVESDVELALLDALAMGGIYGWSGDALGMATQIVESYAKDAEHARIELAELRFEMMNHRCTSGGNP